MTTKWSPASCTLWIWQSTYPRDSSIIGEPVAGAGDQSSPENLSTPRLAIWLDSSAWSSARKLTQNVPERWIAAQAREVLAGTNRTSGGLSETLENDWQVSPTGAPPLIAVTTVTPDANRPRTSRNRRAAATASGSSASTKVSSPGRNWKSYIESPSHDSIRSWLGQVSRASARMPSGISASLIRPR